MRSHAAWRRRSRRASASPTPVSPKQGRRFRCSTTDMPRISRSSDQRGWFDFSRCTPINCGRMASKIPIDDDFPFRLAGSSGDFDAVLESSGIDWFELSLGIEIEASDGSASVLAAWSRRRVSRPAHVQRWPKAAMISYLPLVRRPACFPGRRDRLLPLVLALHALSLNGALFAGRLGKIRLGQCRRRAPSSSLEGKWIRLFKGADNLRRLADLLRSRGQEDGAGRGWRRAPLRPYQEQGLTWLGSFRKTGWRAFWPTIWALAKPSNLALICCWRKREGA